MSKPLPTGPDDREASSDRSATTPSSPPRSRWHEVLIRLRPLARQSWTNLKVWIPFLLNPADRSRHVIYHAREHREGFNWHILLPQQCWKCGREDDLWQRQIEVDRRGFEYPLTVVGAAGASALFFWLLAVFFRSGWMLFMGVASLIVGGAVLYAKSWIETVKIDLSTCREDADALRMPGMAVHENELHLFLPSERLADATRAQLKAERLGRARGLPGGSADAPSRHEPIHGGDRYQSPHPRRPEPIDLPPIKLAGDDDE